MLPAIDIPITLPFEVPVLLHPPLVHFAIVLPVVILLLEFVNLFMKKRAVSVVSLSFLTLLVVVLLGSFFTGKADGSEAFDALSGDAKELLKEHKLLGTYLVYGSVVLLLLKFLNLTKVGALKVLYMLALAGFVFFTLHQGKEGGELVYKHGTNVSALADMDEKAFDLQEELDEANEALEALKAEAKEPEAAPEAKEPEVKEADEAKEPEVKEADEAKVPEVKDPEVKAEAEQPQEASAPAEVPAVVVKEIKTETEKLQETVDTNETK